MIEHNCDNPNHTNPEIMHRDALAFGKVIEETHEHFNIEHPSAMSPDTMDELMGTAGSHDFMALAADYFTGVMVPRMPILGAATLAEHALAGMTQYSMVSFLMGIKVVTGRCLVCELAAFKATQVEFAIPDTIEGLA